MNVKRDSDDGHSELNVYDNFFVSIDLNDEQLIGIQTNLMF
jgi:hypothetical protein